MSATSLDFNHLAKFGLDRFTVHVELDGDEVLVTTAPFNAQQTIMDFQSLAPNLLIDDATSTSISFRHDGSLSAPHVRNDRRGQVIGMMEKPRNNMFADLELMHCDDLLKTVARKVATQMIQEGIDLDMVEIDPASPSSGILGTLETLTGLNWGAMQYKQSTVIRIPGAHAWVPSDYKSEFNRDRVIQFKALVRNELPAQIELLREKHSQEVYYMNAAEEWLERN